MTNTPKRGKFCFLSKCFNGLTIRGNFGTVFRQEGDDSFIDILNGIRVGEFNADALRILSEMGDPEILERIEDVIEIEVSDDEDEERDGEQIPTPVYLCASNQESNAKNRKVLDLLNLVNSKSVKFESVDQCYRGRIDENEMKQTLNEGQALHFLDLKRGCQVIAIFNIGCDVFNDSRGICLDFEKIKKSELNSFMEKHGCSEDEKEATWLYLGKKRTNLYFQ